MLRDIHKPQHDDPEQPEHPDRTYVRSRSDDRSWWIKTSYAIEKYRVIVYLVGAILISLGFGFRTPKAQFEDLGNQLKDSKAELQAQIDTLKAQRAADLEKQNLQLQLNLFSVRYICSTLSAADKYRLAGTDACDAAAHITIGANGQ